MSWAQAAVFLSLESPAELSSAAPSTQATPSPVPAPTATRVVLRVVFLVKPSEFSLKFEAPGFNIILSFSSSRPIPNAEAWKSFIKETFLIPKVSFNDCFSMTHGKLVKRAVVSLTRPGSASISIFTWLADDPLSWMNVFNRGSKPSNSPLR